MSLADHLRALVRRPPSAPPEPPPPPQDPRVGPLADAHHQTRLLVDHVTDLATTTNSELEGLRPAIDELYRRTAGETQKLDVLHDHELRLQRVERHTGITTFLRFLSHLPVAPTVAISVVMPTRNRSHRVDEAIDSVRAQTYPRWELLIVDDGSTDGTDRHLAERLAELADPRIRCFTTSGVGACGARNRALDEATGDVVTYLDDDNRFDRLWLTAVAWAFTSRPDTEVLYGARVIDDLRLLHEGEAGGFPAIQFEPFDRPALERGNYIDCGVIAHRRQLDVRFDETLQCFGDWDLILQLTTDRVPLELPAIAVHYCTDEPERLSGRQNAYFLADHEHEAERVRANHQGAPAPGEPPT